DGKIIIMHDDQSINKTYLAPHIFGISAVSSPAVPASGRPAAQFANHHAAAAKRNAKLVVITDDNAGQRWPFLVATRLIRAGDEIFYSYGKRCFDAMHMHALVRS